MFIWAGPPVGTSGGQVRSRRNAPSSRPPVGTSESQVRSRRDAPSSRPPVGTSESQVRSRRDAPNSRWNALRYEIFGEKVVAAEMVSMLNDKFFGPWLALHVPLRVQVPNNHIPTPNLYHNYYYPKPKYPIIGYLDPLGSLPAAGGPARAGDPYPATGCKSLRAESLLKSCMSMYHWSCVAFV